MLFFSTKSEKNETGETRFLVEEKQTYIENYN